MSSLLSQEGKKTCIKGKLLLCNDLNKVLRTKIAAGRTRGTSWRTTRGQGMALDRQWTSGFYGRPVAEHVMSAQLTKRGPFSLCLPDSSQLHILTYEGLVLCRHDACGLGHLPSWLMPVAALKGDTD